MTSIRVAQPHVYRRGDVSDWSATASPVCVQAAHGSLESLMRVASTFDAFSHVTTDSGHRYRPYYGPLPLVIAQGIAHPTPERDINGFTAPVQRLIDGEQHRVARAYVGKPIFLEHIYEGEGVHPLGAVLDVTEGPLGQIIAKFYINPNTRAGADAVRRMKSGDLKCLSSCILYSRIKRYPHDAYYEPVPLELSLCKFSRFEGTRLLGLRDPAEKAVYWILSGLEILGKGPPLWESQLKRQELHTHDFDPTDEVYEALHIQRKLDILLDDSPRIQPFIMATTAAGSSDSADQVMKMVDELKRKLAETEQELKQKDTKLVAASKSISKYREETLEKAQNEGSKLADRAFADNALGKFFKITPEEKEKYMGHLLGKFEFEGLDPELQHMVQKDTIQASTNFFIVAASAAEELAKKEELAEKNAAEIAAQKAELAKKEEEVKNLTNKLAEIAQKSSMELSGVSTTAVRASMVAGQMPPAALETQKDRVKSPANANQDALVSTIYKSFGSSTEKKPLEGGQTAHKYTYSLNNKRGRMTSADEEDEEE
jgi:hypothetical protein